MEKGKIEGNTQSINFLDITVILHDNRIIETEIYYKATNNHHYLEYNSFHPNHIKNNIPYNLAKRIIVFTTNSEKETKELQNLRVWLRNSNYPPAIINKAFHNAKLQGPAPDPKKKVQVIPFVTGYCDNYTNNGIVKKANMLIQNCPDTDTKECFEKKDHNGIQTTTKYSQRADVSKIRYY